MIFIHFEHYSFWHLCIIFFVYIMVLIRFGFIYFVVHPGQQQKLLRLTMVCIVYKSIGTFPSGLAIVTGNLFMRIHVVNYHIYHKCSVNIALMIGRLIDSSNIRWITRPLKRTFRNFSMHDRIHKETKWGNRWCVARYGPIYLIETVISV